MVGPDDDIITTEQAREIAIRCHERQIQHQQRWVNHYQNRLIYERAMLDESGGVVTRHRILSRADRFSAGASG